MNIQKFGINGLRVEKNGIVVNLVYSEYMDILPDTYILSDKVHIKKIMGEFLQVIVRWNPNNVTSYLIDKEPSVKGFEEWAEEVGYEI